MACLNRKRFSSPFTFSATGIRPENSASDARGVLLPEDFLVLDEAHTVAEVATLESIPLGTAKSRIRLGLAKLRDAGALMERP